MGVSPTRPMLTSVERPCQRLEAMRQWLRGACRQVFSLLKRSEPIFAAPLVFETVNASVLLAILQRQALLIVPCRYIAPPKGSEQSSSRPSSPRFYALMS